MGLTASSGYDTWGYECLGWEIGEYEEGNKLKVVGKSEVDSDSNVERACRQAGKLEMNWPRVHAL